MAFYDLDKESRNQLVNEITSNIFAGIQTGIHAHILQYFSDADTYIRKTAYIAYGRIYFGNTAFKSQLVQLLEEFLQNYDFKVRQTAINAAGEIGKRDFATVAHIFDTGLFDVHHSPRNAVIGSIKKMGEVNPEPVLTWSRKYLHHPDKEIRREICHGIELRGRTHPQDLLPLLKELQFDKTKRVRSTLVHVLGQISYKKGCLETVMNELSTWENKKLIADAIDEIIDVHHRYRNFSFYTQEEAREVIEGYILVYR